MATFTLRRAFYALVTRSREYELHVANLDDVRTAAREFDAALQALPAGEEAEAAHIIQENPGEAQRLKENLRRMPDPEIKRFCNTVLVHRLLVPQRSVSYTTRLFEAFIQGITHFEDRNAGFNDAQPAYHRLFSCGPGDDSFRNTFQRCALDMPRSVRLDVRKRIETCYIERLLYDEIFRRVSLHFPAAPFDEPAQDDAHVRRMAVTHDDFRTCYPDIDIRVDVEYEGDRPFAMTVTRTTRNKITSVEAFQRTFWMQDAYDAIVECTRSTELRTWRKAQTYAHEEPWKQRMRDVRAEPFPPQPTTRVDPFTAFD